MSDEPSTVLLTPEANTMLRERLRSYLDALSVVSAAMGLTGAYTYDSRVGCLRKVVEEEPAAPADVPPEAESVRQPRAVD